MKMDLAGLAMTAAEVGLSFVIGAQFIRAALCILRRSAMNTHNVGGRRYVSSFKYSPPSMNEPTYKPPQNYGTVDYNISSNRARKSTH